MTLPFKWHWQSRSNTEFNNSVIFYGLTVYFDNRILLTNLVCWIIQIWSWPLFFYWSRSDLIFSIFAIWLSIRLIFGKRNTFDQNRHVELFRYDFDLWNIGQIWNFTYFFVHEKYVFWEYSFQQYFFFQCVWLRGPN
jgi:hypothetical protein